MQWEVVEWGDEGDWRGGVIYICVRGVRPPSLWRTGIIETNFLKRGWCENDFDGR